MCMSTYLEELHTFLTRTQIFMSSIYVSSSSSMKCHPEQTTNHTFHHALYEYIRLCVLCITSCTSTITHHITHHVSYVHRLWYIVHRTLNRRASVAMMHRWSTLHTRHRRHHVHVLLFICLSLLSITAPPSSSLSPTHSHSHSQSPSASRVLSRVAVSHSPVSWLAMAAASPVYKVQTEAQTVDVVNADKPESGAPVDGVVVDTEASSEHSGARNTDSNMREFNEHPPITNTSMTSDADGEVYLDPDAGRTLEFRLAFGSCNRVDKPQPLWKIIEALQPSVWMWLGDAVYSGTHLLFPPACMYTHPYIRTNTWTHFNQNDQLFPPFHPTADPSARPPAYLHTHTHLHSNRATSYLASDWRRAHALVHADTKENIREAASTA